LGSTLALKSHQQNRIRLIEIANVANPHPGGAVSRSVIAALVGWKPARIVLAILSLMS
jgi:hypothetical protein